MGDLHGDIGGSVDGGDGGVQDEVTFKQEMTMYFLKCHAYTHKR